MAIGYRTVLRLDKSHDAIDVAEEQLRIWLTEKSRTVKTPSWDGPGLHKLGERSELQVVHDDYGDDGARRRLYRLVETNPTGKFIVSVYAAALPRLTEHTQTIVVEVEKPGASHDAALETIDPPKIVRLLLQAATSLDGRTKLSGAPIEIRAGGAAEVVRAITDPSRLGSVVVAGSFAPELDAEWAEVVGSLTTQGVGVQSVYVVFADALGALDAALPESHRIGGGRVRTFLPKVDLSDPSDSIRHKWLGPATLSRSLEGRKVAVPLQRRHAEVARRRFVESELPADVRRTIGELRRAEVRAERAAKVAERLKTDGLDAPILSPKKEGAPASAEPWQTRVGASLGRWLGVDATRPQQLDDLDDFIASKVADSDVAGEQLGEAATREEELATKTAELQRRIDDLELDLAQAEQDDIENQRELTELRRRLAQTMNPDTYVEPDSADWAAPDSVEELVQRITVGTDSHQALRYVEFTGDVSHAIEIDRRYPSGLYARTMWLYIRVLHDYAVAKERGDIAGNVHMYLTDDRVDGTKCAPIRHAARESDMVLQNAEWSAERVFPVPAAVDPSGRVLMDAHFKPTHKDSFAPRMHYFDDTNGSGKVYVGYIGKHLTNTRT